MKRFFIDIRLSAIVLIAGIVISSCTKNNDTPTPQVPVGPDVNFYALTDNNTLLYCNGKTVAMPSKSIAVTGLPGSDKLLGIDFRPNTGQLFGISSGNRLYIINLESGAATPVGAAAFATALDGTFLGFDFNPTVDRIRVVTNTGQNLRLNPETGGIAATDGSVASAAIAAVAYTQSRAGATSTVLFDIDVTNNKLYRQDPPNAGTLVEVGNLNVDAEGAGGFDISSDSAFAIAALTVGGKNGLYSIDLKTGAATLGGIFGSNIIGIAIPTQAAAYAVSTANELLILDPTTGTVTFTKPITGLLAGENILGIDMRPATGQLFALGNNRILAINVTTGAATQVGAGTFSTPLVGTDFGFDFNPTVDRIRVVSNTGQNLRLNPIDGTVAATDGALNPSSIVVSAAAYTNSFAGATTTVLFDIDAVAGRLVKQDPPNTGGLVDIGSLGITLDAANGFDIGGTSGIAYGIFTAGGTTNIYSVNLTTGAATKGVAFTKAVRGFTLGLGL